MASLLRIPSLEWEFFLLSGERRKRADGPYNGTLHRGEYWVSAVGDGSLGWDSKILYASFSYGSSEVTAAFFAWLRRYHHISVLEGSFELALGVGV